MVKKKASKTHTTVWVRDELKEKVSGFAAFPGEPWGVTLSRVIGELEGSRALKARVLDLLKEDKLAEAKELLRGA